MNVKNDIRKDINLISEKLNSNSLDENEIEELHKYIDGKYQSKILNWGNSMYGWNLNFGFMYSMLGKDSLTFNLSIMKSKLEGYLQNFYIPQTSSQSKNVNIYNSNNNNNSNSNNIEIKLNFDNIADKISNSESLTREQTDEALNILQELKDIYNSKDSKKNKWEKSKKILLWLADKSVDVAISYFPIILEILK